MSSYNYNMNAEHFLHFSESFIILYLIRLEGISNRGFGFI